MNSRNFKKYAATVLVLGLLVAGSTGCTPERDQESLFAPQDVGILVIDAVLMVGQTAPVVKLSRTLAPDVVYTQEAAAVVGAVITLSVGEEQFSYTDLFGEPGYYRPLGRGLVIQPETEYELSVETDEGEILSARTLTPALFNVERWVLLDPSGAIELRQLATFNDVGDSVYFQPANQISYAEGLLQAQFAAGGPTYFAAEGYQLALFSIDPDSDYVIEPPFFDDEDFEDLPRKGSSPALIADSGEVSLPWFSIFFQGRYLYKIFAVDRNWYDLIRSTPQTDGGLGFGGNAGDGTDNPIFHIDGGIGLFGSAAADSVGFFITPQE